MPALTSVLRSNDWPGNVREPEPSVQRATIVCRGAACLIGLTVPALRSRTKKLGIMRPPNVAGT